MSASRPSSNNLPRTSAVLLKAAPGATTPRRGPSSAKAAPGAKVFDPQVYTPSVKTRLPDGSILVRAGVPVILNGEDEVGTAEAARIMGCSRDYVGRLCDEGIFVEGVDQRRIGKRGNYRIKRAAVLRHAPLLQEANEQS